MRSTSDDEFPLLSGLGLYASDIRGDGKTPPQPTIYTSPPMLTFIF